MKEKIIVSFMIFLLISIPIAYGDIGSFLKNIYYKLKKILPLSVAEYKIRGEDQVGIAESDDNTYTTVACLTGDDFDNCKAFKGAYCYGENVYRVLGGTERIMDKGTSATFRHQGISSVCDYVVVVQKLAYLTECNDGSIRYTGECTIETPIEPEEICGDKVCSPTETFSSCPQDCLESTLPPPLKERLSIIDKIKNFFKTLWNSFLGVE